VNQSRFILGQELTKWLKKTSDSVVQMWQKAFKEMSTDGTIEQIRSKWNVE
jgi:ABC-type amino acid transport substrate-binding protein